MIIFILYVWKVVRYLFNGMKWNLFEKVLISLLCKFMNGYIFKLFRMCFGYEESCFIIIVYF